MVGIQSYAVYIPYYRLNRADIGKSWDEYPIPGEKAIANFDEDIVTMAQEACRSCLAGIKTTDIDSLYLASTTFSYAEKQSSALLASSLDLGPETSTIDLAGSLRSGMSAVKLALNGLGNKENSRALVAASDMRLGAPKGNREMAFGDGAAALVLGNHEPVAVINDHYSVNNDIFDVYRGINDRYVRSWEERFVREKGYTKIVVETVSEALKKFQMKPSDFAQAVIYAPNPGYLKGVAGMLGFDPKTQVKEPLFSTVGNTGTAHAMALLCCALEEAKPGDKLLWVSYGDGCDVMTLTVTEAIAGIQKRQNISRMLNSKMLTSYQKYLRWREIIETEPPMRPRTEPASAVALNRDRKGGMALYGSKCNACGTVQYPVQRICMECRAKDNFEYYPFADRPGTITTFSHDNLAVSPDPPTTVAAIDFEGGGRMMIDITDRNPKDIEIGLEVEMTFRKFRCTEGVQVYWWKSRPKR